jgi:hypothetical protein
MNSVVEMKEYNKEVDNTQKNNPNKNKETIRKDTSDKVVENTYTRKYNTVVYDA